MSCLLEELQCQNQKTNFAKYQNCYFGTSKLFTVKTGDMYKLDSACQLYFFTQKKNMCWFDDEVREVNVSSEGILVGGIKLNGNLTKLWTGRNEFLLAV